MGQKSTPGSVDRSGPAREGPERFVGTTSKPKVQRERREDGPAAAEVRWPALRLARPEIKLPRLTVTAFTNLTLTDQH